MVAAGRKAKTVSTAVAGCDPAAIHRFPISTKGCRRDTRIDITEWTCGDWAYVRDGRQFTRRFQPETQLFIAACEPHMLSLSRKQWSQYGVGAPAVAAGPTRARSREVFKRNVHFACKRAVEETLLRCAILGWQVWFGLTSLEGLRRLHQREFKPFAVAELLRIKERKLLEDTFQCWDQGVNHGMAHLGWKTLMESRAGAGSWITIFAVPRRLLEARFLAWAERSRHMKRQRHRHEIGRENKGRLTVRLNKILVHEELRRLHGRQLRNMCTEHVHNPPARFSSRSFEWHRSRGR